MSSTTPAGWYPDPEREGATRWWDGAQWAPSQEPAADDDRFKPRDDADASTDAGAEPSWSPEPYAGPGTAWDGQEGAQASWNAAPASSSQPSASAPAWQQQETPSWQPAYGAPQDAGQGGAQQWNSYDAQPKKSRTGLFVAIGAGGLVLLLLLVGGGIWAVSSFIGNQTQVQTQGGGGGGGTGGGGTGGGGTQGPGSFEVSVGADGESYTEIEITTAGEYQIDVVPTNGEDPRIELSGNGQMWEDDDSGDETWASRLTEYLDVGTYTLMVREYSGDPLVATVTVAQV